VEGHLDLETRHRDPKQHCRKSPPG